MRNPQGVRLVIEVIIRHKGSEVELGRIEIENVSGDGEFGNYSVRFGVDRIKAVGLHRRAMLNFPRTKYNVLGLLLQALNTLEPAEMEFEKPWEDRDSFTDRPAIERKSIFKRGHW